MKVRSFKTGDTMITTGSVGTSMFFIDVGSARVSINGLTATELEHGEYFGETAFVATCKKELRDLQSSAITGSHKLVHQADVVATAPCRLLEFCVKDMLTVLKSNPTAAHAVAMWPNTTSDERLAAIKKTNKQAKELSKSSLHEAMTRTGLF